MVNGNGLEYDEENHTLDVRGDALIQCGFILDESQEYLRELGNGRLIWLRSRYNIEGLPEVLQHPRYIEALLIQSRGVANDGDCNNCEKLIGFQKIGLGPFELCKSIPGNLNGCCGNCRWQDKSLECSYHHANTEKGIEEAKKQAEREKESQTTGGGSSGRPQRTVYKPERPGMVETKKGGR